MTDDPKELIDPKTFSFINYADEFDTHISKSIRGYSDLRDDVVGISKYFVVPKTQVLDIGCSEGSLIERIAHTNMHKNPVDYVGCEINPAFSKGWSKPERGYRSFAYPEPKPDGTEGSIDWSAPEETHDRWVKLSGKPSMTCRKPTLTLNVF